MAEKVVRFHHRAPKDGERMSARIQDAEIRDLAQFCKCFFPKIGLYGRRRGVCASCLENINDKLGKEGWRKGSGTLLHIASSIPGQTVGSVLSLCGTSIIHQRNIVPKDYVRYNGSVSAKKCPQCLWIKERILGY